MKRLLQGLLCRFAALRRDERGYAVMATLAIFLFLFVLCAAVYAVGETIHERIKIQNACDAAAYSAATVQADGLSRMACVNRAMSWTYVQMSNRQMDYITYRWLWLTCKRFKEDRDNAKQYADHIVLIADKELGFYAILEAIVSAVLEYFLNSECDTGNHRPDNEDGHPWWAGQEGESYLKNLIKINEFIVIPKTTTYGNLNTVREKLGGVVDGGVEGSAQVLGKLIDWDKVNIYQMNKSLARINYEMTRSMRETAENVLKASLTDNRLDSQKALSDYYVSIHIPYARNPYTVQSGESTGTLKSYFSPLRNTEVDERAFLQMQSQKFADKPLAAHFPKLLIGNTSTAFGLDQWFIRGKGRYLNTGSVTDDSDRMMSRYDDEVDLWMKSPATNTVQVGTSSWLQPDSDAIFAIGPRIEGKGARLTNTERSEGELGIQRVYKDTRLNESGEGFKIARMINVKKIYRGNHLMNAAAVAKSAIDMFSGFIGGDEGLDSPDDDDDDDPEKDDESETVEDSSSAEEMIAKLEAENKKLVKDIATQEEVNKKYLVAIEDREKNINDPNYTGDKAKLEDEKAYYEQLLRQGMTNLSDMREQLAANKNEIENIKNNKGNVSSGNKAAVGDDSSGDSSQLGAGLGGFFSSLIGTIFTNLGDYLVDITPSCTHIHGDATFSPPMCKMAKSRRTGLVSQYRWASCKWYCLTKFTAYLYSMIWNDGKIWCDRKKHLFHKIGHGRFAIKFKARGIGHFGFPKWFCGRTPDQPLKAKWGWLNDVLHKFPPFPLTNPHDDQYEIPEEDGHGYTSTPWDLEGFGKPFYPLLGTAPHSKGFARDDYRSCVPFVDGSFNFWEGNKAYAGLVRGHARIYGDDKEIFDNRYVGAKCMPWILNEKFFNGEGSIIVGAAKKFYNPFTQLIGFFGNEKAIADYNKSVLSAFKIPKNNYMWTMSAARAGVRRHRRNSKFDKERMYHVTYDPIPDAASLHYHDDGSVLLQYNPQKDKWDGESADLGKKENELKEKYKPLVWDGCVCRTENKERFRDIWNLCESDWDATLLPLRYSCVGASLYLPAASGRDRRIFVKETIRERRNMVDAAYRSNIDCIGAGTNWVWTATSDILDPQRCEDNPFTNSWWKRATDDYFDVLNLGTHSLQFLPEANTFRDTNGRLTDDHYWSLFQLNRIL